MFAPRPVAGQKRKLDHKPNGTSVKKPKHVEIEDEIPLQEVEEGPAPPPEDSELPEEEVDEDDEDGRFFGGGITDQENQVLDYIDQKDDDAPPEEVIDLPWLKKAAKDLESKASKNAEQRAKYENDPVKFIDSESALDEQIQALSVLSQHPKLYRDFVKQGLARQLVDLLAHDNTDIAIAACNVLGELVDEDNEIEQKDWDVLVKELHRCNIVDVLTSNLERLDEKREEDATGVFQILTIVENLMASNTAAEDVGEVGRLVSWLKSRTKSNINLDEQALEQNRTYAAEILGILAQSGPQLTQQVAKAGVADVVLQLLSVYRNSENLEQDPDEEEFVGNLFNILCSVVKDEQGKQKFIEDEGIQLCLILIKESEKSIRTNAFRLLDHAASSQSETSNPIVCETLVQAAGLKPLFTTLMKSKDVSRDRQLLEHIISILLSMLRYLPASSSARIRLLAKFVENDYEKVARLKKLRKQCAERIAGATEMDTVYEDLMLQIDLVLAWVAAEDRSLLEGADAFVDGTLLIEIRKSLDQQLSELGVDTGQGSAAADALQANREMIEALAAALS